MIPTKHCRFTGCRHSQLETIEQLDTGLCGRHLKQFTSSEYVTLTCWSCEVLLDTFQKEGLLEGVRIEDDYLFTKKCPECDKSVSYAELQFVTTSNEVDKELSRLVTDDSQLVAQDNEVIKTSGL